MTPPETREPSSVPARAVLELTVHNHAGVMSHVCGLFSRRAYNVEGILCLPVEGGSRSRIWLLVEADGRLEQIVKQVRKLEDVLEVEAREANGLFCDLARLAESRNRDWVLPAQIRAI